MSRPAALVLLLITTMLWGFAFIAQKSAMDAMGPLTFTGVRYLIGGLAILPLALREYRRRARTAPPPTPRQWQLIAALSLVFFLASWGQQAGLTITTVTNGGFLTALYVLFVPVIAFLALRTKPHPILYLGVPMALVGIYWLNGGGLDRLNAGDAMVTGGAVFWALHVLLLGYLVRTLALPIFVSAISFLGAGAIALTLAFIFETPTLAGLSAGWVELAYASLLSTAIAFTLQAVAQQYVPAANAAIILSAESLFAALGGALILGERLLPVGYAGAALIFLAILLVEVLPAHAARRAERRRLRAG